MEKIKYYTSPWKNGKRNFENHCPILLLPIFSKVFEKMIFNKMYTFLQNEQLLNPNQSGFRPSDSCINQFSESHTQFSSLLTPHRHSKLYQFFLDISKLLTTFGMKGYFVN